MASDDHRRPPMGLNAASLASRLRAVLAGGWLVGLSAFAWGHALALYGYVDGAGVAHFADRRVDSRYAPVLANRRDDASHVVDKTMQPATLLTWLEFAPEVRAADPWLERASRATGVDAELLKAVIAVESGYRSDLTSAHGAIGLMQITPDTGDRYATRAERSAMPAVQRLHDPAMNVMTGARMLADLTRRYRSIAVALAAWNAGEATVRRAGRTVPDIAETQAHVHLVLELYWALLQQRQQGRAHAVSLVQTPATPSIALR